MFLHLLSGHGRGGGVLHYNDDDASSLDSRLQVDLAAGSYTAEATTYRARRTGTFTVTVDSDHETVEAQPVTVSGLGASYEAVVDEELSFSFAFEPAVAAVSVRSVAPSSGLGLRLSSGAGTASVSGTPTRAGAYVVTFAFAQTGRVDTRTATVNAVCPTDHTQQDDRSCLAPADAVCPAVSWGTLGLDNRTVATAASWSVASCPSQNRPPGRYAKYYNFTLDAAHDVAIDLSSRHDTYLYLLSGHDTRKGYRYRNDDIDWPDNANSQILRRLPAGDYTVEATTYGADKTGGFKAQARIVAAPDLTDFDSTPEVTVGQFFSTGFSYRPTVAELTTTVDPSTLTLTVVDRDGHVGLSARPQLAGTYTITLEFAQPGRVDTETINITATCPSQQAPSHTGDGTCVPVVTVPAGCAVSPLGGSAAWFGRAAHEGPYTDYGSGAPAACTSMSQTGRRAKYWSFTVPAHQHAGGLPATVRLEVDKIPIIPVPLVPEAEAGYPNLTLWKYEPAEASLAPRGVQHVASDTSRQSSWHPSVEASLAPGDYLVEIAPTNSHIGLGRFALTVRVPTAARAHTDVQHVGNTGLNGAGMNLAQFLTARGSLAKSTSIARSDPSDPTSPTHPWLAFTADWCSVPASWKINLLQTIINSLGANVDLAQYIVQEPSFGGVTVPFYYGCLRHDFNWRNLHRVKHFFQHDAAGVWSQAVRLQADERLRQDLIVLCNANQYGEPEVPNSWNWTLSVDYVSKCKRVALAFMVGVSVPPFPRISYSH